MGRFENSYQQKNALKHLTASTQCQIPICYSTLGLEYVLGIARLDPNRTRSENFHFAVCRLTVYVGCQMNDTVFNLPLASDFANLVPIAKIFEQISWNGVTGNFKIRGVKFPAKLKIMLSCSVGRCFSGQ